MTLVDLAGLYTVGLETRQPRPRQRRCAEILTGSAALALILIFVVAGAVGGRRYAAGTVSLYRTAVSVAIDAPVSTPAQASVVAAGANALLNQMRVDGTLRSDLGTVDGLLLDVTQAAADRIEVSAISSDPERVRKAVAVAARRLVESANQYRAASKPETLGGVSTPGTVGASDLTWARGEFDRRRAVWTAVGKRPAAVDGFERDRDALIEGIYQRGVVAGRQAQAVQQEMSRVQTPLAAVTKSWFSDPLHVARPASSPVPWQQRSEARLVIAGALMGVGLALVMLAAIELLHRLRATQRS